MGGDFSRENFHWPGDFPRGSEHIFEHCMILTEEISNEFRANSEQLGHFFSTYFL